MYLLLLLVGSGGYVLMTLLGFMHGGGARGHQALGAQSHHGAALPGHHGPGTHLPAHSTHHGLNLSKYKSVRTWLAISPLDIFSFSLGAGAAGLLFESLVATKFLPLIAILGALVFNLGIVHPLMHFLMRFASKESAGLEGMIAQAGKAITRFDDSGKGLIQLCLDGQNIQLLATLDDAELHHGVQVNKGDEVVVIEVDAVKNTCRVTRELS